MNLDEPMIARLCIKALKWLDRSIVVPVVKSDSLE
jgi:hypothetical protein